MGCSSFTLLFYKLPWRLFLFLALGRLHRGFPHPDFAHFMLCYGVEHAPHPSICRKLEAIFLSLLFLSFFFLFHFFVSPGYHFNGWLSFTLHFANCLPYCGSQTFIQGPSNVSLVLRNKKLQSCTWMACAHVFSFSSASYHHSSPPNTLAY